MKKTHPVPYHKHQQFFEKVYEIVKQIPTGRVTTYGAIASCLGTKSSARMVGWAMNNAHFLENKIPAHRVVNRKGLLTGKFHFPTLTFMEEQLKKENIKVVDDLIIDFKNVFWNPLKELI